MAEYDFDLSLLPPDLQPLGPLILRYRESDDVQRSEVHEGASDDDLRELSAAPTAHWHAINAFLDQHVAGEPGPHQDVARGQLLAGGHGGRRRAGRTVDGLAVVPNDVIHPSGPPWRLGVSEPFSPKEETG